MDNITQNPNLTLEIRIYNIVNCVSEMKRFGLLYVTYSNNSRDSSFEAHIYLNPIYRLIAGS